MSSGEGLHRLEAGVPCPPCASRGADVAAAALVERWDGGYGFACGPHAARAAELGYRIVRPAELEGGGVPVTRYLCVILNAYLLSGMLFAPLVIVATAMHANVTGWQALRLISWGAVAIVALAYVLAALG